MTPELLGQYIMQAGVAVVAVGVIAAFVMAGLGMFD